MNSKNTFPAYQDEAKKTIEIMAEVTSKTIITFFTVFSYSFRIIILTIQTKTQSIPDALMKQYRKLWLISPLNLGIQIISLLF